MKQYHAIIHLEGEDTSVEQIKREFNELELDNATITDVHVEEIES
jgi:hypothetical protein